MKEPTVAGTSNLDIYRTAQMLIAEHGHQEAWLVAEERAAMFRGDPLAMSAWVRIIEAVKELSRVERGPAERMQ